MHGKSLAVLSRDQANFDILGLKGFKSDLIYNSINFLIFFLRN